MTSTMNDLELPGRCDECNLELPVGLSFQQWKKVGDDLIKARGVLESTAVSLFWWIGDWLNFGERKYGETYTQAIELTGYSLSYLQTAKYVASRIDPVLRKQDVPINYYQAITPLDKRAHSAMLMRVNEEGMTLNKFKQLAYDKNKEGKIWEITLKVDCEKKYKIKAKSERQALFEATRKVRCNLEDVDLIGKRTWIE